MRRTAWTAAGCGTLALVGLAVWQGPRLLGDDDGDRRAAQAFAEAWTAGTLAELTWDPASGQDPAGQVAALTAGLTPAPQDRPAEVRVTAVEPDGDEAARARLDVRWELGARWQYASTLPLRRSDDVWRPVLEPTVVHPELAPGQVLRSRVEQALRASITDRDGTALVADRPVVTVGLQTSRAPDLAGTVRQVAALTGVDEAGLLRRATAADPDDFLEVITLRREAYFLKREQLRPLPGVVLREGQRALAPTADFARALLGTVGPATAEVVQQSEGRVRPDQAVGLSGLQRRYDEQLGGSPGLVVETTTSQGAPGRALLTTPPVPGTPLQITLDSAVQRAADEALAGAPEGKASALVVVQPSTGDLLAVANAGPDGPGADRALTGRYPPGSTFKIASTLALLRAGLQPDETVPCPATATVSGKAFRNAEQEVLGDQPFRTDFAQSCNTAFVGSADRITSAQLQAAAADLGYATPDLGVDAFGGDVPVTTDPVQHAAQVIGQGQVLASPLTVAMTAAAVADGQRRAPRLLAAAPPVPPGPALPETAVLRELTRLVVAEGTATALSGVPGEPVGGKTGTAEFGTDVPPRTHAWFAGWSGDLALAVLVEDGGFGGEVAAPLAADLLRSLRAAP